MHRRTDPIAATGPEQPAARAGDPGAEHATELKIVLPFGSLAMVGSVCSLSICYGSILAAVVVGVSLPINPHLQAVLMWGFAVLVVYALWRDRPYHGANSPLVLGAVGATVLIATLYLNYDTRIEAAAYVLLVIAALANQNVYLNRLNRRVREQAAEISALNRELALTVQSQDSEIGRLSRLKEFLAPQVAELLISDGRTDLLETHRRYIACLFCDIRNFTAASDSAEPEEVIAVLQAFHDRVGQLVLEHRGTIGFRAGDGVMAFFNDPIPCDEPVLEALRLALDIRNAFDELRASSPPLGQTIGLGIGIASGYASLGFIGFKGRGDYTAVGRAVNIAARLCDMADDGQILISQRALLETGSKVEAEPFGAFELKGVGAPVETYLVRDLRVAP